MQALTAECWTVLVPYSWIIPCNDITIFMAVYCTDFYFYMWTFLKKTDWRFFRSLLWIPFGFDSFFPSYKWIVRTRWNSFLKIIIIWIHRIQSLFKPTVKANSNKSSVTRSCQTRTSDIYHYIIISHINKNIALNIFKFKWNEQH